MKKLILLSLLFVSVFCNAEKWKVKSYEEHLPGDTVFLYENVKHLNVTLNDKVINVGDESFTIMSKLVNYDNDSNLTIVCLTVNNYSSYALLTYMKENNTETLKVEYYDEFVLYNLKSKK